MPDDTPPKMSEALAQFKTDKKSKNINDAGYQELRRFANWISDRELDKLTPNLISEYAVKVAQSGADAAPEKLQPIRTFLDFLESQGWANKKRSDHGEKSKRKLSSHLRPPRSKTAGAARAAARQNPNDGRTYLSQEGYDNLLALLEERKRDRTAVTEEIRRAMADKDFRENAPLDAAKDRQGRIETEIRELETSIANAHILQEGSNGIIARSAVGARMTLKETDSGQTVHYTLVDVREADVRMGRISTQSPVGQALLDRSVGEEVVIKVPNGTRTYIVEEISGV